MVAGRPGHHQTSAFTTVLTLGDPRARQIANYLQRNQHSDIWRSHPTPGFRHAETFPGDLSALNWAILKHTHSEMDAQCTTLLNKFSFVILQLHCFVGSFHPNSYKTLLHNTTNSGLSKYSYGCLYVIQDLLRSETAQNWLMDLFTVTAELARAICKEHEVPVIHVRYSDFPTMQLFWIDSYKNVAFL